MTPLTPDEVVRHIFPRTTGEAILGLFVQRTGEIVTLEDMAVAAYGDTPDVWQFGASEAWGRTARSHIGALRKRLLASGLALDIETVIGAGYRLVARQPRRRMSVTDIAAWREKCLAEYHRLAETTPDLTLTAACLLITKKYRRRLYWSTLADWLGTRPRSRTPAPQGEV